jgi:hypothetical protein
MVERFDSRRKITILRRRVLEVMDEVRKWRGVRSVGRDVRLYFGRGDIFLFEVVR